MTKPLRFALAFCVFALAGTGCLSIEEGDGPELDCLAPVTYFPDGDGDGFGDKTKGAAACEQPAGHVAMGGDCDDASATIHPNAKEICDTKDNDCDSLLDDLDNSLDVTTTGMFYRDIDGDDFGTSAQTIRACVAPAGYTLSDADCNDSEAAINPSATEICDQLDNDCDAKVDMSDVNLDQSTLTTFYRDFDNDQHGGSQTMQACTAPFGYVAANDDCNDNDNLSFPGGTEICDGADNDCDGGTDGTLALPNRCSGLVGTYNGSYNHLTQEKVGTTVVNSMSCTGNGSASLQLNRRPGLQGTFTCTYSGGMTLFSANQRVTLRATVGLNGAVTGTAEHEYSGTSLRRTYNVTGTQTASGLSLTGTGSWYPSSFSAVPWQVNFTFSAAR